MAILDYCLDGLPKEIRVFAAQPDLNIDQTQPLDPLQTEHLQSQVFTSALSLCVHIHLGQLLACFLFLIIMLLRCFMTISCMYLMHSDSSQLTPTRSRFPVSPVKLSSFLKVPHSHSWLTEFIQGCWCEPGSGSAHRSWADRKWYRTGDYDRPSQSMCHTSQGNGGALEVPSPAMKVLGLVQAQWRYLSCCEIMVAMIVSSLEYNIWQPSPYLRLLCSFRFFSSVLVPES